MYKKLPCKREIEMRYTYILTCLIFKRFSKEMQWEIKIFKYNIETVFCILLKSNLNTKFLLTIWLRAENLELGI